MRSACLLWVDRISLSALVELKLESDLLVEHDPLRSSGNAVMALIQSRQFGQHSIVIVCHDDSGVARLRPGWDVDVAVSTEYVSKAGCQMAWEPWVGKIFAKVV